MNPSDTSDISTTPPEPPPESSTGSGNPPEPPTDSSGMHGDSGNSNTSETSGVPESSGSTTSDSSIVSSSSSSCSAEATLTGSVDKFDFGILVPPSLDEVNIITKLTKDLENLNSRLTGLTTSIQQNPNEADINEMSSVVGQMQGIFDALAALKFNITALVPLPIDAGIIITLDSNPTDLSGSINAKETQVRKGSKKLDKGVGSFFPNGSNAGFTKITTEYSLTGNYGIVEFTGVVACCGTDYSPKPFILTVTGECKENAQLELTKHLAKLDAMIAACTLMISAAITALTAAVGAIIGLVGGPLTSLALGLLGGMIGALIAGQINGQINQNYAIVRAKISQVTQPYIDALPPCQ